MSPLLAAPTLVRRVLVPAVVAVFLFVLSPTFAPAQAQDAVGEQRNVVEVLPLRDGLLDPPVTAQILDVLAFAEERGSQLLVLQYSSPGGVSVDLELLLDRIEASEVPVAVLVGPLGVGANAAGAAGMLWLGADIRAISADATVGPLDPVDLAVDGARASEDLAAELLQASGGDVGIASRLATESLDAEQLTDAGVVTLAAQGLEPLLVELDGMTVARPSGDRALEIRASEVEVR
ncbi:MAG: hypothetical protein WD670_02775, partial [Actinomycetota bacterium]